MTTESDTVAEGREAWERIRRGATFADWAAVARALLIGRGICMATAMTNKPVGTTYNKAMGEWLRDNGLDGISAQERNKAVWIIEHLGEVEKFRADLPPERLRRFNHPNAIWSAMRVKAPAAPLRHVAERPRHGGAKGPNGRAVFWPQSALRRAADAMRESRSSDWLVLAKCALEAGIRDEHDLAELIADFNQTKRAPSAALELRAQPPPILTSVLIAGRDTNSCSGATDRMAEIWSRPDIGARPTASVSGRRWRPAMLSK
jgi:hypothetical protein